MPNRRIRPLNAAVTDQFERRIVDVHGELGGRWLARLPEIIRTVGQRWDIEVRQPFEPLSYNYVAPARRSDGTEVVAKLGVPGPELTHEARALEVFGGRGAVRLLAAELEVGALMLERVRPGTLLAGLEDDEQATSAAADVMRRLRAPPPPEHGFPTVAEWARGFERLRRRHGGGTGALPARLVDAAERIFAELNASMQDAVVLHGDLHHQNILSSGRERWLAIDPKGVIGEPEYEVGALLRNPMPELLTWPSLERVLARRVDQMADELAFDRRRILRWGAAQAVLSAVWDEEDHGTAGDGWLKVADGLLAVE
jgi:streptomycin 6-kinase